YASDDPNDAFDPNWAAAWWTLDGEEEELQLLVEELTARIELLPQGSPERNALEAQRKDAANAKQDVGDGKQALDPYQTQATDTLDGGEGDDELFGSSRADRLVGGPGSDRFHHSGGDDLVSGGTDSDGMDEDVYVIDTDDLPEWIEIVAVNRAGAGSSLVA